MREIVIDTETTGLDPLSGHRVVEIGAVELVDHSPTGRTLHCYLNPERAMPADAVAVHGEFLADKQLFADVADELLAFVGDAPLLLSPNCGRIAEQSPQAEGPWDCVGDIPQDEDIYEPPGDIEPFPS